MNAKIASTRRINVSNDPILWQERAARVMSGNENLVTAYDWLRSVMTSSRVPWRS